MTERVNGQDRARLSALAQEWVEIATSPIIKERKERWRAINDLKSDRPVVRTDAFLMPGFVTENDLSCIDPELRNVERYMVGLLRQFHLIGDDVVWEPYFRIPWKIDATDMGVTVTMHKAKNDAGPGEISTEQVGYSFENPIRAPKDINRLRKREFSVDREATLAFQDKLDTAFDGILPTRIANMDYAFNGFGGNIFTGNFYCGITVELFKLLGYETLMYWMYDEPEIIHRVMDYLTEDKIALFRFLEEEQLLDFNTDNQFAGSVHYGYCSYLPQVDTPRRAKLSDLWCWCEAQETIVLSPEMYAEFVAPYMGRIGRLFGLVFYGCCERYDDRYDFITRELPNLRGFSTTKWNDLQHIFELCDGKQMIFRKLAPENISGEKPRWEDFEADVRITFEATKGKNTVCQFGDLYDVNHDWNRLREAVARTRELMHT